jgi:sigma-B regulation protein RsbU (phosphoserine phosphatase)
MATKLVVVDDEPDMEALMRQHYRRQIRNGEYAFEFASNGEHALQVLDGHRDTDVVLTDINMPVMDGLTLIPKLAELSPVMKTIVVSAYGDMDNIRAAMNNGAFDFITKPFDFDDLDITIEKTLREVAAMRAAEKARAQLQAFNRDLVIAREVQASALPSPTPTFSGIPEFDLAALMLPAQAVGGDFYDYFMIDADRLGFLVGDVAGKGLAAAMFMLVTRTLLRATALQGLPVEQCIRHVNRILQPESAPRMFVTLVYGELHRRSGTVTYCNAGHNLPYHLARDGAVEPLPKTGGLGLCLVPDFTFKTRTLDMAPGDTLVFYTDGVTEAMNIDREQFGEKRLVHALRRQRNRVPAGLVKLVSQDVRDFASGARQADDITLLAVQYRGHNEGDAS